MEFFYNSRADGDAVVSRVNGEEIRITAESLQQQFDIGTEGLASTSQEQPSSFEEFLKSIAVPGTLIKELRRSMSTNLLKEEYRMLAVLISKGIMGMLGSHDSLSTPKIVTIDWILKKKPVN